MTSSVLRLALGLAALQVALATQANPIVEVPLDAYKERAHVRIVAAAEYADVSGQFLYKQMVPGRAHPSGKVEKVNAILVYVPVFFPRAGHGPKSYQPYDDKSYFLREHGVQIARGTGTSLANGCRKAGDGYGGFKLSPELAGFMQTFVCDSMLKVGILGLGFSGMSGDGEPLRMAYRQYHARASAAGPWLMVYVPLFESLPGPAPIETASLPERYRVDIEAAKDAKVRLKLASRNKVVVQSEQAISVVPVHAEPIVVEIR